MTRQSALTAASSEAPKHGVPPGSLPAEPEQTWIELPGRGGEPVRPTPVADLLVWIVRFWNGPAWIDLAVADADGRVVRVTKSRGFVMSFGGPGVEYPEVAR